MKRVVLFIGGLLMCGLTVAQNELGSTDDMGRIALTPIVIEESGVPSYARKVLTTKLKEIVTRNGLSSTTASPRFVITAAVDLLNKEMTATAPPMTAVELATTLYIGDAVTGQLFATHTYNTVKGLGTNDQRAYLAAFKGLRATSTELDSFVEKGKQKIVEYYNSQIDFLLAEAKALADQEKYDESMALLSSVPSVCKDAYTKAMATVAEVYQKKIDVESAKFQNQATAAWKTNKTKEGATNAVDLLANIHPNSSSAAAGKALAQQIEAHYAELAAYRRQIEERNWNYKVQSETEMREMQRDKMHLDHELAMHQSDNSVAAGQQALAEVKNTTQLFLNAMSDKSNNDFVGKVSTKIKSWFQ